MTDETAPEAPAEEVAPAVEEAPVEVVAEAVPTVDTGWTVQSGGLFVLPELRYAETPIPERVEFGSEAESDF